MTGNAGRLSSRCHPADTQGSRACILIALKACNELPRLTLRIFGSAAIRPKSRQLFHCVDRTGRGVRRASRRPSALVRCALWHLGRERGAFDGDAVRELAAQFLTLAEKQAAPVPLLVGHRIMGVSLMFTGNLVESRDHVTGKEGGPGQQLQGSQRLEREF